MDVKVLNVDNKVSLSTVRCCCCCCKLRGRLLRVLICRSPTQFQSAADHLLRVIYCKKTRWKSNTYSAPDRRAEYCDERVCVFVCPRSYLRNYSPILLYRHRIFTRVTYGRGSVRLLWRSDTLRISGFMNDVIFAHKLRLLDVAARLRQ